MSGHFAKNSEISPTQRKMCKTEYLFDQSWTKKWIAEAGQGLDPNPDLDLALTSGSNKPF